MKGLKIAVKILNVIMVITTFLFAIFAFNNFFASSNLRLIMSIVLLVFSVATLALDICYLILNRKRK